MVNLIGSNSWSNMKKICLLGASGSIGVQTLDVIYKNPQEFVLTAFSVGHKTRHIAPILKKNPFVSHVYLIDDKKKKYYQNHYPNITFLSQKDGLENIITLSDNDMVVNALVGFAGLVPSIVALENNKLLALANKESLVVGGELINKLLKEGKGKLYPIDSEHSALWKCLKVDDKNVRRLILTASGGAFRKLSRNELETVTAEDALKHPTWRMGAKITIDCATMMNKTFELIEAYYLFGFKSDKLAVQLHDESYLHSFVEYENGLYRGEINKPDMRNPIRFALFEGNIPFQTETFHSLNDLKGLHFHDFSLERYPIISLAKEVIDRGGSLGAVINATNEVAVNAFLKGQIKFLDIEKIVHIAIEKINFIKHPNLEQLLYIDAKTRKFAAELIKKGV